ncbi:MAG: Rho termination factor N-terminal domain-containing protein, partial [candidate division NC10 bacterium]|nr:Rho termination factor N-terminal domain-containing protein [candidate division NC10 bacterium]
MSSQRHATDVAKETSKEGKEPKETKAMARDAVVDSPREGLMNLAELTEKTIPELNTIARSLGLVGASALRKQELIF